MNSKLNNEAVLSQLTNKFGGAILDSSEPYGLLTVEIQSSSLLEVVQWIKDEPSLQVSFLTNIAGVHYPETTGREFAVVYHLHSLVNNFRIRLKCFLSENNLMIDSLTSIYSGANWMERETFDFYGIQFNGHPNLVRILNEDAMDYFPMRKQYHLEDETREDKDDRFFGR